MGRVDPAVLKALIARTEALQAENHSLKGEVAALRAQREFYHNPSRQEVKESAAKAMFVVCLVAGLLLAALVSGRVFSGDAYASRLNLHKR